MRTKIGKTLPKEALLRQNLAVLLLGSLCGLLATCKKPELPLRVRVSGCPVLWTQASRLVCAAKVLDKQRLILSIDGPPLARLRFRIGDASHGETKLSPVGHATVKEPFPKVASQVTLRVESEEGEAEYTLDIRPVPFAKASARRDTLDCGQSAKRCLESAQKLVARLDAGPPEFDPAEQAFLLGILGLRLGEVAAHEAQTDQAQALRQLALSVLERAMSEGQKTGLLSVEALALDRWGDAMSRQRGTYDRHRLVAELSDPRHKPALDQYPRASASVKYTLSWIELEQGNLTAAKLHASEAAALAEEFDVDPHFQIVWRLQEALAAQSLQQTRDAERIVSQVEKQLANRFLDDPCQIAKQYNSLAWIKLVARQSGHAVADPDESFDRVDDFLSQCEKQPNAKRVALERAVLSTNRALYALLRAEEAASGSSDRLRQLDRAEAMTRQARDDQGRAGRLETPVVQQDLAYLAARIALLRGMGEDALRAFAQLEQLTTLWLSPHYRWASQIGQADAHLLRGETAEARTCYERVEDLLDRMTTELPMTTGHQLFLRQFEAGTGRYLKLLLAEPGAQDKILDVIRHARVRALRTYARWPGAGGGPTKTDELLNQYMAYMTLLDRREATQAELSAAPSVEQETLRLGIEQLKSEQKALLEALYAVDPAARARQELRPPAAGELVIACYPLPAEPGEPPPLWVCAGGTADGTQVLRIAAPTEAAPEQAAQAVLTGFGKALGQARHLRILSYGPLRAVAWASLPWAGGRLGAQLTISYGVDPPSLGEPRPPAERRALLVTNPQQDLIGAQRAGERLRQELSATGWQVDARAGAPRRGGHLLALLGERLRGQKPTPALANQVAASLPGVDLFVYYGHAESLGPGGWDSRLRFAEDGSISALDIMSLPVVPRKVLLIGCETAVSDREAPADEAGLAQAFVLRGSEAVLATTRKVSDVTAEALVDKLAQLGALRPDGPPLGAALRDAVAALRLRHPAADLDAFRVYTP